MASINEIAIKISADTSDAVSDFEKIDRMIKKLERQMAVLSRAGKEGGALFGELESERDRLRALGDQIEETEKKAKSFFESLDSNVPAGTQSQQALRKLEELDRKINRLKADEQALRTRGLAPTSGAIHRQIRALEAEKQKVIQTTSSLRNMTQAEIQAGAAINVASAKMGKGAKGFGKYQVAISQAAFGLEDFMTQIQYGLGPALRGAGNNISMVAHSLKGPLAGGIIGVTAALLPSLISMLSKTKEEAKDTNKEIRELADSMKSISGKTFDETGLRLRDLQNEEDVAAIGELDSKEEVDNAVAKSKKDLDRFRKEVEIHQKGVDEVMERFSVRAYHTRAEGDMIRQLLADVKSGKKSLDQGLKELESIHEKAQKRLDKKVEDLELERMKALSASMDFTKPMQQQQAKQRLKELDEEIKVAKHEQKRNEEARKNVGALRIQAEQEGLGGEVEEQQGRQKQLDQDEKKQEAMERAAEKRKLELDAKLEENATKRLELMKQQANERKREAEAELELLKLGKMRQEDLSADAKKTQAGRKKKAQLEKELQELESQKSVTVAGGFSAQANVGALIQQTLDAKFNQDKDVKREEIKKELEKVNKNLESTDAFIVVGGP